MLIFSRGFNFWEETAHSERYFSGQNPVAPQEGLTIDTRRKPKILCVERGMEVARPGAGQAYGHRIAVALDRQSAGIIGGILASIRVDPASRSSA